MIAVSTLAIAAAAADAFGVKVADVVGPGRGSARQARARQTTMWLAVRLTCRSYTEIGRSLGRDRTSVRHGVDMLEALRRQRPELRQQLADLETTIRDTAGEDFLGDGDLIAIRETILDPVEIARRALAGHRGATSVSTDELWALARAFLARSDEADTNDTGGDVHAE